MKTTVKQAAETTKTSRLEDFIRVSRDVNSSKTRDKLTKEQQEQYKAFKAKYHPFDISMSFVDAMSHYRTFVQEMHMFARLVPKLDRDDTSTLLGLVHFASDWHMTNAQEYEEEASVALEELHQKRDMELGF